MTLAPVKRSQFKTLMNTTFPFNGTTPIWSTVGKGVTDGSVNMNPKTLQETYIDEDTGHTQIESYMPAMPIEATAQHGDAVFDYVDNLRVMRAVLGDAITEVVNVYLYETPSGGEYPAEKQSVSIQIEEFGGGGGTVSKIKYAINYLGAAVQGTFNPTTLVFTANP